MPVAAFGELNERLRGRGQAAVRQPAQRARPGRCGRRTRGSPPAARSALIVHGLAVPGTDAGARRGAHARLDRAVADSAPVTQSGWYERLRGVGTCRSATWSRWCPDTGRRARVRRVLRRAPARPARTRSTAWWSRSTSSRRAAAARLDQPRAPVGDRLQVPAGGGDDPAARHPGERRPHRAGHPVRRDGAGQASPGRRWTGPPCTTRTRSSARASSSATWWCCARPGT